MIAKTPKPPYYAVIFTSVRRNEVSDYEAMADSMAKLAAMQPGFLGFESAREEVGITVSYWDSLQAIKSWKQQAEHQVAQQKGRTVYYSSYKTRVCIVERDYGFEL